MNYNADGGLAVDIKTNPKGSDRSAPVTTRPGDDAFTGAIGRLVRLARAKRGMTRRQLA